MQRLIKGIILFSALFLLNIDNASAKSNENSALKEEIRTLLRENPEIILEILRENDLLLFEMMQKAATKRQMMGEKQRIQSELQNPLKPVIEKGRPVRGSPDAPVTIVAYDDF
tara:strand:- start:203 stop:541 length:339 start_codon:yes stop_codon:yes gene_type:complete